LRHQCQRLGFVDIGTLGLAQLLPHQAARIEQLFPAGAGIPVGQMALGNAGLLVIDEFVGDAVSESQVMAFFMVSQFLMPNTLIMECISLGTADFSISPCWPMPGANKNGGLFAAIPFALQPRLLTCAAWRKRCHRIARRRRGAMAGLGAWGPAARAAASRGAVVALLAGSSPMRMVRAMRWRAGRLPAP
jgi:hypothetical protein